MARVSQRSLSFFVRFPLLLLLRKGNERRGIDREQVLFRLPPALPCSSLSSTAAASPRASLPTPPTDPPPRPPVSPPHPDHLSIPLPPPPRAPASPIPPQRGQYRSTTRDLLRLFASRPPTTSSTAQASPLVRVEPQRQTGSGWGVSLPLCATAEGTALMEEERDDAETGKGR